MRRATVQHRRLKADDNTRQASGGGNADAYGARQGGGHRSRPSGAGTSEKVDRRPGRKGPSGTS